MSSAFITTKMTNSIPTIVKVYLILFYVIKYVFDLRQDSGCFWVLLSSPTNNTECHGTTEKLLTVVLIILNILETTEETL